MTKENAVVSGEQRKSMISLLREANKHALDAMNQGHHPFSAMLVGPDQVSILLTQGNIDTVNHAESTLVKRAAERYPKDFLWHCTLYTTVEPCAMCSGTCYWGNVGKVVYGMSERKLLSITGDHEQNPTLDLPCREIFSAGQKNIQVFGPFSELENEIAQVHYDFWKQNNES